MKINVNDPVKVQLTDYGRKILLKNHYPMPKEDDDGWSEWQLWVLMEQLGQYCHNGTGMDYHPFLSNIYILDN